MNRRKQDRMTDAEVLAYLKKHYIYDPRLGKLVRKETGRVAMGANKGCYMSLDIWTGNKVMHFFYHRAVWAVVHGYLPKVIDHINGNPYDNRLVNLREVSQSENNKNVVHPWRPNARTGLPGVYKQKSNFIIRSSGKRLFFSDKYEAFFYVVLLGRMYSEV